MNATTTCILIQSCDVPLQPCDIVLLSINDGLQMSNDLEQCLPFRRHIVNLFLMTVVLLTQETQVLLDHTNTA